MAPITYPETKRVDIEEQHFGLTVIDPYRWLETDVSKDPAMGLTIGPWRSSNGLLTVRLADSPQDTVVGG